VRFSHQFTFFLPSYHNFSFVTGYGDDPNTPARSSAAAAAETDSAPSTLRSGRKIRKTRKEDVSTDQALSGGNNFQVESTGQGGKEVKETI